MKIIILTFFLFCGMAGVYAQTNNSTRILPEQNPSRSIESDSNALHDGASTNGLQKSTNDGSQNSTQHQTDTRNEYEAPKSPDPEGKTTTPNKTLAPANTKTPNNKKSTTPGGNQSAK